MPAPPPPTTPLKIGCSLPITGAGFNAVGDELTGALKVYMQQHGDTVAGRKIELIIRDDGGAADNAHRLIQEMIVNDKVDIIGTGITPCTLAIAQLVTEAKKATLLHEFRRLDHHDEIVRTSCAPAFIITPQAWTLAEWAIKNGSKPRRHAGQ